MRSLERQLCLISLIWLEYLKEVVVKDQSYWDGNSYYSIDRSPMFVLKLSSWYFSFAVYIWPLKMGIRKLLTATLKYVSQKKEWLKKDR